MKKIYRFLLVLIFQTAFLSVSAQSQQERPNILVLTFEDSSPALGCYGNKLVKTPVLDSLARIGIKYNHAYSNGTQCSPSRSTLILGKYAIAMGTDLHRGAREVPKDLYYPVYLKKAGYYCVAPGKQDYNTKGTPKDLWSKADYSKRLDKNQPFFAVYNYGVTHMTRVATLNTKNRSPRTVDPAKVRVPAYIPDLPEVRDDIAWHHDAMNLLDGWVAERLQELKASGESDNTIVFISSDHGGCIPRGKAYLYESGTRIPLIIRFPEKFKKLAGVPVPQESNRLVSFIDFAPTFLNLAGAPKAAHMDGKAFLGPHAESRSNVREYVMLFKSNQGPSFVPSRAITDGQYRFVMNFHPSYPDGTRQSYQWQMPAQMAWDKAYMQGNLSPMHRAFWELTDPVQLFDTSKDPEEVQNLINQKEYAAVAERMKKELIRQLREIKDLGLFPAGMRQDFPAGSNLYEHVRKTNRNTDAILDAAILASYRDPKNTEALKKLLQSEDPVVRYWGSAGLCGLAKAGKLASPGFLTEWWKKSEKEEPEVKIMMAEALVYSKQGGKEPLKYLLQEASNNSGQAMASMQNLNKLAMPVAEEIAFLRTNSKKVKDKFYLRSVLINLGKLDYDQLYVREAGEKAEE